MRYGIFFILCVLVSDLFATDLIWYASHPDVMNKALAQCPQNPPQGLTCEALQGLAVDMRALMYALQTDPLEYGHQVMVLQADIVNLTERQTNKTTPHLAQVLSEKKRQLSERLAMIKLLESPE